MNVASLSINPNLIVRSFMKQASLLKTLSSTSVKCHVEIIQKSWIKRSEFETIRLIGSGAFGDVSVVRWRADDKIYALKSLHKYDMLKRSNVSYLFSHDCQRACFQEERDVMVRGRSIQSKWIAKIHHAFQDEKYLYLLMDFYNGGDMLTMLTKFDDHIPEDICRFYMTEIILAIISLHELGFIHRDIKPDNILLESSGHIVLADFGSCIRLNNNKLAINNTAVGTPDYIPPEILRASEEGFGVYGVESDFWSLGVVMYEMIFGETPFYSESLIETYGKIMNFAENFDIPDTPEISPEACDLLRRLICDQSSRIGKSGLDEFKSHPFFTGVDWDNIRESTSPYIPDVSSPEDTSNFDIEPATRNYEGPPIGPIFRGCHVACIGYTFTSESPLNELASSSASSRGVEELNTASTLEKSIEPHSFTAGDSQLCDIGTNTDDPVESTAACLSDVNNSDQKAVEDSHELTRLRQELTLMRETNVKLKSDLHWLEDENETLCKQLADANFSSLQRPLSTHLLAGQHDNESLSPPPLQANEGLDQTVNRLSPSSIDGNQLDELVLCRHLHQLVNNCTLTSDQNEELHAMLNAVESLITNLFRQVSRLGQEKTTAVDELRSISDQFGQLQRDSLTWEGRLRDLDEWADREQQQKAKFNAFTQRIVEVLENLPPINGSSYPFTTGTFANDTTVNPEVFDSVTDGTPTRRVGFTTSPTSTNNNSISMTRSLDWRSRKTTRVNKMARSDLQLALSNETRAREACELRLLETESQLKALAEQLEAKEMKMKEQATLCESLNRRLYQVVNQNQSYRTIRSSSIRTSSSRKFLTNESFNFQTPSGLPDTGSTPRHHLDPLSINDNFEVTVEAVRQNEPTNDSTPTTSSSSTQSYLHQFDLATFKLPERCLVCSSLMLGQHFQGLACSQCTFRCHDSCQAMAPPCEKNGVEFPVTKSFHLRFVKMPRSDTIRRGWAVFYLLLSDFKLFIYETSLAHGQQTKLDWLSRRPPSPLVKSHDFNFMVPSTCHPSRVIDASTAGFNVSLVSPDDVIHVKSHEVARILKITMDRHSQSRPLFIMFPSQEDCTKWLDVLNESRKACQRSQATSSTSSDSLTTSHSSNNNFFEIATVIESGYSLLKSVHCACTFDGSRILLGTEDGLFIVNVNDGVHHRIGDKKPVYQVDVLTTDLQLVVVLQGKHRSARLLPFDAIAGSHNTSSLVVKVAKPVKSCSSFVCGTVKSHPGATNNCAGDQDIHQIHTLCIAAASPNAIYVYQLSSNLPNYHQLIRELAFQSPIHLMTLVSPNNDWLCVGCSSGQDHASIVLHPLLSDRTARVLFGRNDPISSSYLDPILYNPHQSRAPLALIEVGEEEFLIAFESCGIYLSTSGERSRPDVLHWPSPIITPHSAAFAFHSHLLLVFTQTTGLVVYNIQSGQWTLTAPSLCLQSLCRTDGHLCLASTNQTSRQVVANRKSPTPLLLRRTSSVDESDADNKWLVQLRPTDKNCLNRAILPTRRQSSSNLDNKDHRHSGGGVSALFHKALNNTKRQSKPPASSNNTRRARTPSRMLNLFSPSSPPTHSSSDKSTPSQFVSTPFNFVHVTHWGPERSNIELIDINPDPASTQPIQSRRPQSHQDLAHTPTSLRASTENQRISLKETPTSCTSAAIPDSCQLLTVDNSQPCHVRDSGGAASFDGTQRVGEQKDPAVSCSHSEPFLDLLLSSPQSSSYNTSQQPLDNDT